MSKVEIINPLPGGMRFLAPDRAAHYCSRGMATISVDGRLLFIVDGQSVHLEHISEEQEFQRNRGDRVYWNGARNYPGACYPPGCNVSFESWKRWGTHRPAP